MNRCDHEGRGSRAGLRCNLPADHGFLHQYRPMPRVSDKRRQQHCEYLKLRHVFLTERRWCEFPLGCHRRAVVVHHRRGRQGERLLDRMWWAASCNEHNIWAEEQTGDALNIGWLVRVEGVA